MSEFINAVRSACGGGLDGVSDAIILAMSVVCGLLIIVSIFALGVSIFLAISYVRYNKSRTAAAGRARRLQERYLTETVCRKLKYLKPVPFSLETVTVTISKGKAETPYMEKAERDVACHGVAKSALAVLDKTIRI